ncbi:MAG: hypothetical protein GY745_06850 [Actinomycetia bacterium]|nr:hypothetical protein [Actinomycetes bacterium]MCP4084754.1 hypothetical protein [Actinomycetes bacterium]
MIAAFPGSFNPPTIAHLDIAWTARDYFELERVDLVVSRVALAKEDVDRPLFDHRIAVLEDAASEHEWLGVWVTEKRLLVDIADGYDVLIMGADKWHQIQDPVFYDDNPAARDAAMEALPRVAVFPRPPHPTPPELLLPLDEAHHHVSSTTARDGAIHHMLHAAVRFDRESGAWTDPDRYETWLSGSPTDR